MEMEIICISSDDETDSQKENRKAKLGNYASFICGKTGNFSNDDKVEGNSLKRKMLKIDAEEKTQNNVEKKKKLNTDGDIPIEIVEVKFQPDLNHISDKSDTDNSDKSGTMQPNKDQEIIIEKPKLIVKEKKKISYIAHDVFPLFISLCLQKSKDKDRKDMEKIVNKLKRRYEELDPEYTSSEYFVSFLNEKRAAIMYNDKKIYVYIEEVMNEMKKSFKKKSHLLSSNETYDAVPSTSYAANNLSVNNAAKSDCDIDNEENANPRTKNKIKMILQAMAKCEGVIKKLDEAEVDFDKEDNSTYIKVERYKQRMVELYNKYCELTGENADAGRVYLRPKHISATRIVAVDQAITNFINSKIAQRNQMKKKEALANDVIFPDYRDILECVNRCNDRRNLGLDRRKQEQMAKKAFLELGELLQRTRRNDYWDTFSLYLENTEEDPAIKDKDLAKKLIDNRTEGEKRLAAVFEKYTKKQEEIKEENDIETLEEEEEEEESVLDDKNNSKDDVSIASLSEEDNDNEKNINEKDNGLLVENGISNISTINICRNTDKVISDKTVLDISQQKYDKKDKIKSSVKENNMIVFKNKNQKTSVKIVHKICNGNIVTKNIVDIDAEKPEDSLPTCSTADCTSNINRIEEDLPEVITEAMSKAITNSVIEDAADMIPTVVAEPIMEDVTEVMITGDETEVITENATDVTVSKNQQEEEKKPLLRVRSFAKPPTTWEVDSRQKIIKIAQENASKVTNQLKEVVDLTNEAINKSAPVTNKTPPVTKCTIQLGNKVVPVVKSQRLLIPTNRNIISVQNITNNYLKVNTQTGQIIAPVRDICVRLPSAQTATIRQNQPQNPITVRNEVPFRGNETILRIIQQARIA
ncbi:death domain-associated protein 6 isoform X2 [Polyergus mexicanus]|uniref:death domain-associated protein 6 isoform X2 n=1 Tax=Polyergus mexicanus TaxID=615972 RepID=UPI0038B56B28